jgi:hypothetical protein
MANPDLAADHVRRASARLLALDVLFDQQSCADVLRKELARLPADVRPHIAQLAEASRGLRRDRELAFDGAEDLTPSDFYRQTDAISARDAARFVVECVRPHVLR